jgi:hypothetical protein
VQVRCYYYRLLKRINVVLRPLGVEVSASAVRPCLRAYWCPTGASALATPTRRQELFRSTADHNRTPPETPRRWEQNVSQVDAKDNMEVHAAMQSWWGMQQKLDAGTALHKLSQVRAHPPTHPPRFER